MEPSASAHSSAATPVTVETPTVPQRPRRVPRAFALVPRGSSLAGKAYWAMVRRVALTAAAIDAGYIALFWWLGSWPLTVVNAISIAMYLGAQARLRNYYGGHGFVQVTEEYIEDGIPHVGMRLDEAA